MFARYLGMLALYQSWARAFFKASRLRFHAPGGSSSRLRFRALFLALNFALLHSRFCAPRFFALFFALLDFSRSFSRFSIFRAPQFLALVISCSFVFLRPGQDSQDRTPRTGQTELDSQNRSARIGQREQDSKNGTGRTRLP